MIVRPPPMFLNTVCMRSAWIVGRCLASESTIELPKQSRGSDAQHAATTGTEAPVL